MVLHHTKFIAILHPSPNGWRGVLQPLHEQLKVGHRMWIGVDAIEGPNGPFEPWRGQEGEPQAALEVLPSIDQA